MTGDLHQRVTDRIAELRAVAEAAQQTMDAGHDWTSAPIELWRHFEQWHPAFVLRWLDWAQEVAERHQATTAAEFPGSVYCGGCSVIDEDERIVALVPLERCRERPRLVKALGIEEGG